MIFVTVPKSYITTAGTCVVRYRTRGQRRDLRRDLIDPARPFLSRGPRTSLLEPAPHSAPQGPARDPLGLVSGKYRTQSL
ncbi:hypothetical protein EVAR_3197_1 [Eumeta japonica]|uniref:Uncharacterized protein n=1 Tax=Eumeta variegata TaxID=151549 RepID=A0A4C1SUS2_EUMVA|nr:hypothetical protein EVAR_3197_1 [Eumeta japonica]